MRSAQVQQERELWVEAFVARVHAEVPGAPIPALTDAARALQERFGGKYTAVDVAEAIWQSPLRGRRSAI